MAETAGEYTVFWVLFAITAIVILIIFGAVALTSYAVSGGNLCLTTSLIRNFIYTDFGLSSFAGVGGAFLSGIFNPAGLLSFLNLLPPLYCSPTFSQFSKGSTSTDIWNEISQSSLNCLNQFGFNYSLYVNYKGPLLCGATIIKVPYNLTLASYLNYLKQKTVNVSSNNCIQFPSLCPSGYSCDTSDPYECESPIYNYSYCIRQSNYAPAEAGFYIEKLPLYSNNSLSAYSVIGSALCNEEQGCLFNTSSLSCTNQYGVSSVCSQDWQNFCYKQNNTYECYLQYNPSSNQYLPPLACYSTYKIPITSIKSNAYDYLFPGGFTLVYLYNPLDGRTYPLSNPSSLNLNINKSTIFVYYLNSFTGTYLPPLQYSSPAGCPSFTISNSISYSCLASCADAAGILGASGYKRFPLILSSTAGAAAGLTAAAITYSLSNKYLAGIGVYPASPLTVAYYSTVLTTFPFIDCFQCIAGSVGNLFNLGGIDLTSNRLLMCIDINYT
ncbi:MAG: hypothetical protein OH340_02340 [Candidatus Parvarchaeota archaeon]|nr:hypothetical protein [Candidatus Rehaiarchaeum fermentans]